MTTLLNILTADPANQGQLVEMLRDNIDTVIHTLDGWLACSRGFVVNQQSDAFDFS